MSDFANSIVKKLQGLPSDLPSPGTYEGLHKESRVVLPANYLIDGAKFELHSNHNQNFQTTHSFGWGAAQSPSTYHFGAMYATSQLVMHGLIDHAGTLQARGQYNWIPVPAPVQSTDDAQPQTPPEQPRVSSTSKMQAQLTSKNDQSAVHLEHEHNGGDYSVNLKAVNANPFDNPSSSSTSKWPATTGSFSASYLQSISKSLALGAEWNLQRPNADAMDTSTSFCARWAPLPSGIEGAADELPLPTTLPPGAPSPYMPINPKDPHHVFTTTWSPGTGMLHSSYWRRLNQRMEVVAEVQMLLTPSTKTEAGRREGIATVGFKLDTIFASIRAAVESTGRLSAVIEEKVTPNLGFQLNSEIDYAKGGIGRIGFGFTFEN